MNAWARSSTCRFHGALPSRASLASSLFALSGTEALTLEVELGCDFSGPLFPQLTPHLGPANRCSVSLLLFAMQGMHSVAVPWPRLLYREALWRLRVVHRGEPAFYCIACDLDHPLVRALGRTAIRYPVRSASFSFVDAAAPSFLVRSASGALELIANPRPERAPLVEPLPTLSVAGDTLYRIPWRETASDERFEAALEVRDASLAQATLGKNLTWPTRATLMRGRKHHCGLAQVLEAR
jgi:hypothetical protein